MKITIFFCTFILLCTVSAFTAHAASPVKPSTLVALADPTRPDFSQQSSTEKPKPVKKKRKKKKNPVSSLSLQQTLVSRNRKIAIINGKTMTIGNKIRGAKLVRINNDHVVLTYEGKQYTLNLTSPSAIKEVKR